MKYNIGSCVSYQDENYYIYMMICSDGSYIVNFDKDIDKKIIVRVGLIKDKAKYDSLHYSDGTAIFYELQDTKGLQINVDLFCDNLGLIKDPIVSSDTPNNTFYPTNQNLSDTRKDFIEKPSNDSKTSIGGRENEPSASDKEENDQNSKNNSSNNQSSSSNQNDMGTSSNNTVSSGFTNNLPKFVESEGDSETTEPTLEQETEDMISSTETAGPEDTVDQPPLNENTEDTLDQQPLNEDTEDIVSSLGDGETDSSPQNKDTEGTVSNLGEVGVEDLDGSPNIYSEIIETYSDENDLSGIYDSSNDRQFDIEKYGENQYIINGDNNNGEFYTTEVVLDKLINQGCTKKREPSVEEIELVNASNKIVGKKFGSKMSDSSKKVLAFVKDNYNIFEHENVNVLQKMSEAIIDDFTNLKKTSLSVDFSLLKGAFANSLKQFSSEMDEMLTKYASNLVLMSDAQILMDLFIMQSLSLEELEEELSKNVEEYNLKLVNKPDSNDYLEKHSYIGKDNKVHKYYIIKSEYYTNLETWKEEIELLTKTIKELELERDESIEELENIEKRLKEMGYDIKDIKPSNYLLEALGIKVEQKPRIGETRELTGEERARFIAPASEGGNNITDDPSVKIYVTPTEINGVVFDVYDVINENNYNPGVYAQGKEAKLKYLSNVDHDVLQYVANGGSQVLFYSSYTCDAAKDPSFAGYCNSINRNIVSLNKDDDSYNSNAIIHECGHAFDFTLRYNATGEVRCGITANDVNYYEDTISNSFFGAVHEEYEAIFDPLNFTTLHDYNFSIQNGYHGRGPSAVNSDFSLYSHNDLIHEDEGSALEYFAEAFKCYYTPETDRHDRYAFVIPNTFSYFGELEKMVKGVEPNGN